MGRTRYRERRSDGTGDPQPVVPAVGADGTTSVTEFPAVRHRGSAQHLASQVATRLAGSPTARDAGEAAFPSIAACGTCQRPAFDPSAEPEPEQRGLYSGAVLVAEVVREGRRDARDTGRRSHPAGVAAAADRTAAGTSTGSANARTEEVS